MNKKIIASVLVCLAASWLTMTSAEAAFSVEANTTAPAAQQQQPEWKIVQDRVIEITYNNFDFTSTAKYLNKYDMGGCSAVRVLVNGKVYVGRNYDFYCSDSPAFIIRNNAGPIRTIGIGNSPMSFGAWGKDFTVNPNVLQAAPYLCCDVMSEAGIYAETNIRPFEKQLACRSTKPGAPRRCTQTFMQTMLSHYGTIDEILAHVDDYDWFDLEKLGFEQSFFLTDQSGRSVIIEFAANSWKWHNAEYNGNYYIDNDYYKLETVGTGEKRVAHELAYKPYVRTEEDIFTMMKQGAYEQFYHSNVDVDYAISEFYEDTGYNKNSAAADMAGARKATKALIKKLEKYTWQDKVDNHSWESVFITAANVTDKYMNVHFSEHYNVPFKVEFK